MADFFVHTSSIIDANVIVGKATKIWHFSHVSSGAIVGDNCTIGQNVFIGNDVSIGNGVKIQNNVSVFRGVTIEADVFIGPSAVFTNVLNPRSFIERKSEFSSTHVKKGASVGANATIVCGNTIGEYALIGAGAVVTQHVPDFALVIGNPARQVGWVSKHGIKLHFQDNVATCPESGATYRLDNKVVKEVNI